MYLNRCIFETMEISMFDVNRCDITKRFCTFKNIISFSINPKVNIATLA